MKRSLFDKFMDAYLDNPLFFDGAFIGIIILVNYYTPVISFYFLDTSNATDYLSNLISTEVSLTGFILAALTIIVTFRSNIKAKGVHEATNALELILSSKHYPGIVRVFKKAIIELMICLIAGYCLWLSISNVTNKFLNVALICLTISTVLSVLRTLYILFLTLSMEKMDNE